MNKFKPQFQRDGLYRKEVSPYNNITIYWDETMSFADWKIFFLSKTKVPFQRITASEEAIRLYALFPDRSIPSVGQIWKKVKMVRVK